MEEISHNTDVGGAVETGWVTPEAWQRSRSFAKTDDVVYARSATSLEPVCRPAAADGKQQMLLMNPGWPSLRIKPQCHSFQSPKKGGDIALSFGAC